MKNIFNFRNEGNSIEQEKIKNPEIESLRNPIQDILLELEPYMQDQGYEIIIGDDASARIPTLIFRDVLEKINEEKGFEKPKTLFLAGQGKKDENQPEYEEFENKKYERIKKHIEENFSKSWDLNKKKKVLYVTEVIYEARTIIPLSRVLKEKNIKLDIASLDVYNDNEKDRRESRILESMYDVKIFSPLVIDHHALAFHPIYFRKDLGGVKKNRGEMTSHRLKDFNPEVVADARDDVKKLSKQIFEWYKKNNNNQVEKVTELIDEDSNGGKPKLTTFSLISAKNLLNFMEKKHNPRPAEIYLVFKNLKHLEKLTSELPQTEENNKILKDAKPLLEEIYSIKLNNKENVIKFKKIIKDYLIIITNLEDHTGSLNKMK